MDGDIEQWPFDGYTTTISAFATVCKGADATPVPTVIIVDGDVPGGQLAAVANPDMPDLAIDIGFHCSLAIILLVSHWSRC